MENDNQKINVRIGGMTYNLVSSESEQYTRQIAARADEMIRRVAISSPQLGQQMTTILALTNAVDELTRQAILQSLAEQQKDAAESKNGELRTELARTRELNWEMKKELLRIGSLNRQYEARLAALEPMKPVPCAPVDDSPEPRAKAALATIPSETVKEHEVEPCEPEISKPATLSKGAHKTINELRQTGLEEYLSISGQSKSHVTEISTDDEP